VNWHRFGADPDFHVDADQDLDWHENNVNPHGDPTPSFKHVRKSELFYF
jgi:hypothetical protein